MCHAWPEHRGVIVDITADQFGERFPPVIATRRSRWQEAWKTEHEPITEKLLSRWRGGDPDVHGLRRHYRSILARSAKDAEERSR